MTHTDQQPLELCPAATESNSATPTLKLFEDQQETIDKARQAFRDGHRRVLIQSPTGSGKTVIAAAITMSARERKKSTVYFTAPIKDLVDQTLERFERNGISDIGVLQADHERTDPDAAIQIATLQTLLRRNVPPPDLLLVDEAHIQHGILKKILTEWDGTKCVGLTATPGSPGLGKYWDCLVKGPSIPQLWELGRLARYRAYGPPGPDLKGVKTVMDDYATGQLSSVMQQPQLMADIIDEWKAKADNRPTLVFGVDRAHAAKLQERFIAAGVKAGYVDCNTNREDRRILREQFLSREIQVICNVSTMTTGVDLPDCSCLVLARPTKSTILHMQIVGRGLRPSPGKDYCRILDHAGNFRRLGNIEEIEFELDDGSERPKAKPRDEQPTKDCGACGAIIPRSSLCCPHCGFKPERVSNIKEAAGFLVEITPNAVSKSIDRNASPFEKDTFYGELLYIANERPTVQKKQGWVANKFRDKFGHWPSRTYAPIPMPPRNSTRNWVRSRDIAFAKRRAG